MITIPGRIPITIHPFFWIFSFLIGFLISQSILGTLIWVGIIFLSVIVHEMGHALTAIIFKQNPKIQLVALGGMTSYQGKNLKYYKQFIITLNGPIFGFLLYLLATVILYSNFFTNPIILASIKNLQIVNLFWSIINLLPILPMDGGQLLRIFLESIFGIKGFKISLLVGFVFAFILALLGFAFRFYLIGAIFFLFAFQSFDMFRKTKKISKTDRNQDLANALNQAEIFFQNKNYEKAKELFLTISKKTKSGMIHIAAMQYLGMIEYQSKNFKKAYEYLLDIEDDIQDNAIYILHKLAFENENYKLVEKLSSKCYNLHPTQEVALNNARSFAVLNLAKPAAGWLLTAKQFGNLDIEKTKNEKYFEKVKDQKTFRDFLPKNTHDT
ncbi:MAG: Stage IV sporulation protein FB [Candidatus Anoxychlamydiales bacterium]|nr:Stage IV sporulation protein FB [Candidatus Anoxychlamydiales bacterium]